MKVNNLFLHVAAFLALIACQKEQLPQNATSTAISKAAITGGLTAAQAQAATKTADSLEKVLDGNLQAQWSAKQFTAANRVMAFSTSTYGSKPADGRSLYISMHGGGAAPAAINDQQWRNQITMTTNAPAQYNIQEGVVIVPRAPVNDWNMWFQYELDELMEKAIRAAVLYADVNPNKVYIMGYSAGGDGTFRLASRMADHWAAASMSAGHPGEVTPANLRNIGFALNMGGADAAYNRNGLAREWKVQLDALAQANPGEYRNQVNIFEGYPHWMSMRDRVAIPFMAGFTRNPYPNKIDWMQNSFRLRNRFYWIGISNADMNKPNIANSVANTIKISKNGNIIDIENNYADEFYIYLNDKVVNLDENVVVRYQGTEIFNGPVARLASTIKETAAERPDSAYIFSAKLIVQGNVTVTQAE